MSRRTRKVLTPEQKKHLLEENGKGLFTIMELAMRYGISYPTVRKMIREGKHE